MEFLGNAVGRSNVHTLQKKKNHRRHYKHQKLQQALTHCIELMALFSIIETRNFFLPLGHFIDHVVVSR
jgi:hypothetical protein